MEEVHLLLLCLALVVLLLLRLRLFFGVLGSPLASKAYRIGVVMRVIIMASMRIVRILDICVGVGSGRRSLRRSSNLMGGGGGVYWV